MKKGDKFIFKFNINKKIYLGFINLFKDRNPLHTLPFFAKKKGFKNIIMHGNILNGFISYFAGEVLPKNDIIIQTQSIKYRSPIYLEDSLTFKAEIINHFRSVNSWEIKFIFVNQNQKKVAEGRLQVGLI